MQIIGKEEFKLYNYINQYIHKETCVAEELEVYKLDEEEQYEQINNLHDKLFRDLLSDKTEIIKLLAKYLNIELKIEEIEKYNSSFITRKYQNKESDIVYKIKNKNLFFLIEHQSSVDKTIPLRLMEYSIEIIRSKIENIKLYKEEFPRVIPIVIYTGEDRWKIPKEYNKIQAYIGYNGIENLGIDLKYNLIDINNLSIEELLEEETLVSKAIIIERCKTRELILKYLKPTMQNIKEEQKEKMEQIITYVLRQILDKEDIEQLLKELYKESEGKGMNLLTANMRREKENWQMSARKEGIKEGESIGEKRGIRLVAKKMKEKGIEIELISDVTGLKAEEI